jgi:DNA-binding transcriptional LysR family regulator
MDLQAAMRSFCRVVESGSFAAAAREINASPSAVTKYVQHLETWTGSRLLARTTRSMKLTEAGERFYGYCRRVLADTDATLEALRQGDARPSGRLVVSAPVSLTLGLLAPHLHAFQDAHPQIELEVRLNDRPADLVREGIDVALRGRAQLEDSNLVAVPLMQFERVLCAAPAYWQRRGRPERPEDLASHNCLAYLLGTDATRWRFTREGVAHEVDVAGSFRSDNSLLLVDALLAGRGVAVVPRVLAEPALASGRLEVALAEYALEPRRLFAVYETREYLPHKVRAFIDDMRARLRG